MQQHSLTKKKSGKNFMKKIISLGLSLFLLAGCGKNSKDSSYDPIPNFDFQINKTACLFGQSYLEKEIAPDLESEINSSFMTLSKNNADTQSDFISKIIANRTDHEFITPTFSSIMKKSMLDYDVVFDKCSEILNSRKEELKDFSKKVLTTPKPFFDKVFKFYETDLKKDHKFNVFIYPTLGNALGRATSFKDNILLKFNYGNKAYDMCLLLKEVCVRLYNEKSNSEKKSIRSYFSSHKSPYAKVSYLMLEDILANTISLWAHSKFIDNSDSPPPLDQNNDINSLSKNLLPTLSKYLENENHMDSKLFDSIISAIQKLIPGSKDDINILMSKISLITESGIDVSTCNNILNSNFKIKNITNKPTIFTTIFIGNDLKNKNISTVSSKIPTKANDFIFTTKDPQNQFFIIIKTNDIAKIKTAIEKLKQLKEIKDGFEETL